MIVDTEKVSREADGPEDFLGWKVIAPGTDGRAGEEPEDHKRSHSLLYSMKKLLTDILGPGRD